LSKFCKNVIVLKGGMTRRGAKAAIAALEACGEVQERLLLATGRYLGEGFDDARLDTLFLTLPISWRGTLSQYAGRLSRLYAGKKEVTIYDYVDAQEPMLARMQPNAPPGTVAWGTANLQMKRLLPSRPNKALICAAPPHAETAGSAGV
jgi:superfamily II DNA or RNA helicase